MSAAAGTSGTSGTGGTSGLSFNGTSGISGGVFTNQPDYLVKTVSTTTIQSVSFLSVSGTTFRVTGLTHTNTLRVDDTTTFGDIYTPLALNGVGDIYGNLADNNVLGTPNTWLRINISGTVYAIPAYV